MAFWVKDKSFYKSLVVLALPIIFQNVITHSVTMADNMMVGRLGEVAISGLYIGNRIQAFLQILLFGIDSTIIILASQYWGKRDVDRIKTVISIAMRLSLGFTAVVTFLVLGFPTWVMGLFTDKADVMACGASYLQITGFGYMFFSASLLLICAMRSVEMVRIGLINSITALCVNVLGNYLLIFGNCGFPEMGVRGAAIATVVSRIVEFSVVLLFVLKFDKNVRLRFHDFRRWDKDILSDLVRYGAPLMGGQIVWLVNQFVKTIVVGYMDKTAMSAISITDVYDMLLCIGVFGLAAAVGVLTGKAIGQGDLERVKLQAKTMQVIFLCIGIFMGTFAFLFRKTFLSFYTLEPETLEVAQSVMAVLALTTTGRCYQGPCLMGLVKAGGDTSFVFKNDTVFVFFAVIPSAIIAQFVFGAPAWVVYACLMCDQVLKCFVAAIKINRFNWMRNLTRD